MRKVVHLLMAACLLAPSAPVQGRESGWVPISKEPWQPPLTSGASSYKTTSKKDIPRPEIPRAGLTVYDRQPLVTEAELARFLPLLPQFRDWARQNHEDAHPVVNQKGQADFMYSANAAAWVKRHGFDPARFFCIMGRMAAGLAIIEEGNDFAIARPKDMPAVDQKEITLARKHMGELLTAATLPVN